MERIACKECTSPDCHGCNMYRLEQMLMSGKLDALMNENRTIKMDADVRPVMRGRNATDIPSLFECSSCGWTCSDTLPCESPYNYCPNCGADMREANDV